MKMKLVVFVGLFLSLTACEESEETFETETLMGCIWEREGFANEWIEFNEDMTYQHSFLTGSWLEFQGESSWGVGF